MKYLTIRLFVDKDKTCCYHAQLKYTFIFVFVDDRHTTQIKCYSEMYYKISSISFIKGMSSVAFLSWVKWAGKIVHTELMLKWSNLAKIVTFDL